MSQMNDGGYIMLQYISALSDMDYLSTSQIQNELNLRGYFAATTPPASTPPASTPSTVTNIQVLGWSVDAGLQNVGKSLTASQSTDLTPAIWAEISRIATIVAPQLNTQFGTNLAITQGLIDNNLHMRNYWLGSAPATSPPASTPPASLPSITLQAYKTKVIDYALNYYGKTLHPSTTMYLSSSEWSNIVNYAYNYDQSIDQNYNILSGLSGLGNLGDATCFDSFGNTVPCGGTTDAGWGTKWGPTILTLLGSVLSLIGTTWSATQLRNQASTTYYQTTGGTLGTGTTRDAEILARQIQTQTGMSYDQAYKQARILLGLSAEGESDLSKYLLPLGIGIGAYLILSRRS